MKINDNGIIRDMLPEEIREMQEAMERIPKPEIPEEPSAPLEPRVAQLEDDMAAIQTAYMEGVQNA